MQYTQLNDNHIKHALDVIGVNSIDALFAPVPEQARFQGALNIPEGLSELEILRDTAAMASENVNCEQSVCFLGGGAYDHFIPTLVDNLAGQTEFLTGYTPYQAEASQGVLQLFFEFQTMVSRLLGMEVANASLYEVATAAAEAVVMASGITKRRRFVVAKSVHPDTFDVLSTYAKARDFEMITVAAPNGTIDEAALAAAIDDKTAAVVVQSPNLYGCLERLDRIIPTIHAHGALAVVATDPLAGGLLKPPGAFGADIVVAEGQPLGIPMQYGGPYLGLMAGRECHLRKMPGRIVGMSHDPDGQRGFCLVMQTREQHIKRERATSNICTNQGLLAIRATIYMAAMGKLGIKEVARQCFDKAHYAATEIAKLDGFDLRFDAPFFKEFVVQTTRGVREAMEACRKQGLLGGVPMIRFDDHFSDCFLVAVTEMRTRAEIDRLTAALGSA